MIVAQYAYCGQTINRDKLILTVWTFTSTNAKEIGTLYLIFAVFAGMIGTAFSVLIRLELAGAGVQFLAGDHQLFNVIISAHALVMIFFMVMPGLVGGFGKNPINIFTMKRNFSLKKEKELNMSSTALALELRSKLGPYLAGLIESDGTIAVHDKNSKAKKYNPKIAVVFNLADEPLANKLLNITNAGTIFKKKEAGHILWQIQKLDDVIKIINIINGYMRTPKIEALHRAINWLNEYSNTTISCLNLDLSPIDSNAWLAGFTESKSSFIISEQDKKNSNKIRLILNFKLLSNFVISPSDRSASLYQIEWYNSVYFSIFSKISEYLKTSFITKTKHSNNIQYTFIVFAFTTQSQEMLVKYFIKFPLLGNNSMDFEKWYKVLCNKNNNIKFNTLNIKTEPDTDKNSLLCTPKILNNNNINFYFLNLNKNRNLHTSSLHTGSISKIKNNNILSTSTELVIWGKLLPSLVGMGRHTKQERNMISIPSYQYSVIVGLLLSDGYMGLASDSNISYRLAFTQSLAHFKYVWFVFNTLSHYCNRCPILRKRKRGNTTTVSLEVVTRGLPCFTEIYLLFYINKVKVIPKNIYNLLDPIAFAHLIMGDGGFKSKGIFLCTDSYSIQDVVRLMNVLIIRYDLMCTLHKSGENNFRIYISRKSVTKVIDIVKPHIVPSMYYKLGIN